MPKSNALGMDYLDQLTTDTTEPTDAPSPAKKPKRRLEPVKLDGEVLDQVRAAVWWLMHHGQPTATLKALLERAALDEVQRLADQHNRGEAFPNAGALPRGGRFQP